jgi:hypothetical protein
MVLAVAVLGEDQATVGRDGDVVRSVGIVVVVIRRVGEVQLELDRAVLGLDEPDLAVVLSCAAVGRARERGDEVRALVVPPHALQLVAARDLAELLAHRRLRRVALGNRQPADAVCRSGLGCDRQVRHERAGACERLHRLERAGVVGKRPQRPLAERQRGQGRRPAVQQPVGLAGVLGQIERVPPGVDDDGLVRKRPRHLIGPGSRLAS